MSLPSALLAQNLKLVGHHTLNGAPNVGEGLAIKVGRDGRRFLYAAGVHPPMAMSVLDVTDPATPELVWQMRCAHDQVRGNCLTLFGDTLLLASQTDEFGMDPAGFYIFDISSPQRPEQVGFFDSSGPHSKGVHFVAMMDDRYAHISSGAADFEPVDPKDHQFYQIVDLADRADPTVVGRWWLPGQRKGDAETIVRHERFDHAMRAHHTLSFPQRPDRTYIGYIDAGIVILDVSDKANPKLVHRYDYHPPMHGFTHTVVPLFDRDLFVVTEEALKAEDDWPKRYWLVDARLETNLVMMSSFPVPDNFDEWQRSGGRIGAHNIHENHPEPGSAHLQNTCVTTWFSAGVRIYDIRDPFTPKEIAAYVPETPAGQKGCRINDVFVDDRGIIYAGDRINGGVYILEYTGDLPLD